MINQSKRKLMVLTVFLVLALGGCVGKTSDQLTGKITLGKNISAKFVGMDEFTPFGGYKVGSIIVFDEKFATLLLSRDQLADSRKGKKEEGKRPPPSIDGFSGIVVRSVPFHADLTFDVYSDFKLHLETPGKTGKISVGVRQDLHKVKSIQLHVKMADRVTVTNAASAFDKWIDELGPQNEADYDTLTRLFHFHKGKNRYMVTEALKLVEGTYTAEWGSYLSAEAKNGFGKLFEEQANIHWLSEQEVKVKVRQNAAILVAFKKLDLSDQMDKVEKILKSVEHQ